MRKWLCLLLAAMLCACSLAGGFALAEDEEYEDYEDYYEEVPVELGDALQLELEEVNYLDLDGDGEEEIVVARMRETDEDENLCVQVETDELVYNFSSYIIYAGAVYAADLDGDGAMELLLSGDEASADYSTWCLKFSREGGLQPLLFADANRGDNTGDYFEYGYGRVRAIEGATLTLEGSQDALGTWMCTRQFTLRDGQFELDDDGVWKVSEDLSDPELWDYRCLIATRELPVTLEDGSESTLPTGTRLLVTGTDKQSFVSYETQDGQLGRISVSPNTDEGWGFLISGRSEDDYFEYIPYAD